MTLLSRRRLSLGAALTAVAGLVAGGSLALAAPAGATPSPPAAGPAALTTGSAASGIAITDVDGVTITSPTAAVTWDEGGDDGDQVTGSLDSFDNTTVNGIKNGYDIRVTDTRTQAGHAGARVRVAKAVLGLRGRAPVTVTNLDAGVAPDGRSFVSFDSLTVGDTDITEQAQAATSTETGPGQVFTYDVPSTGPYTAHTVLTVGRVTADGGTRVVAISLTDDSDVYEVSRLTLGDVSAAARAPAPADPARVTGVQVTDPDGTSLLDASPSVGEPGAHSASAADLWSTGVRTEAHDVAVRTDADGSEHVQIGSFRQTPRPGLLAEYYPSALVVNGLTLDVAPDGTPSLAFADPSNALFVDGRWINALPGVIYTALDDDGEPRLEVRVGERVDNADGTVTVTAVRYHDLTATWPDVTLGQVTTSTDDGATDPGQGPGAPVEHPDLAGRWHAFGVAATGAVDLAPTPLAAPGTTGTPRSGESWHGSAATVGQGTGDDGEDATGQIALTDVTASVAASGSSASAGSVALFPGTAAAVDLRGLRTTVTDGRATVTSDGGTVLGTAVPAGTIAPDTVIAAGGVRVTLAHVTTDPAGLTVAAGLVLDDQAGLGSTVVVAQAAAGAAPVVAPSRTTTTSLALARSSRAYGKRARATVTVRAPGAPSVAGTVRVLDGDRVVASAPVARDAATATVAARLPAALAVGTHRLTAVFVPATSAWRASRSGPAALRVTKARPKVRVTVRRKSVRAKALRRGVRPVVVVRVKGPGAASTGRVRVVLRAAARGGKQVKVAAQVRLRARDEGVTVVRLPRLGKAAALRAKGPATVTARYRGDARHRAAKSVVTARVR